MNENKKEFIILRVSRELKDKVKNKAESQGLDISKYIRTLLDKIK